MSVWIVHLDKVCGMGTIVCNKDKNKQFNFSPFLNIGQDRIMQFMLLIALSPQGPIMHAFLFVI